MRALLVGVTTKDDRYNIKYSLEELKGLCDAIDIEAIDFFYQSLDKPNSKTYVGSGKLSEISISVIANSIDIVVFNDELTPTQLRNIEEYLEVSVIDRSYLILKIFELRAQNKEAKLEIKLAKDLYLLPRIQYLREKDDRIGGGSATKTRGSGETQRELDRRHLMSEIYHIKDELAQIRKMKINQIEKRKRNEIPIVALVGYTNAGKSSTMNTILEYVNNEEKMVLAKDQLFATLSTFNRKITINKTDFMLEDTIGFVSKLPHNLVESFYQTLQEVKNADLIIHVLDSSSPYINEELNVVLDVLDGLNAINIPTIFLLNKWDLNDSDKDMTVTGFKSIKYSNKTKEGLDELINSILEEISPSTMHARLLIPYSKGDLSNIIEKKATIIRKEYQNYGTYFECEIPKNIYALFHEYDLDTIVS